MSQSINSSLDNIKIIVKREMASYFATPIAYVFIVIFLCLSGYFTFYFGNFYERGQADLGAFFSFHPWLYLFLVPSVAMRLWSEERKSGSIELLMTLPVTTLQAVIAKFLAAWSFIGLALIFTFPIWITVNYLGEPDNGAIITAYLGSVLMAGGFLAIGACISAFTKNQVVAFILSVVVCFAFLFSGYPLVLDVFASWAPDFFVNAIASLSFLTHFNSMSKGVIEFRDVFYFIALIAFWLYANALIVDLKKAD